jgi:Sortase domain
MTARCRRRLPLVGALAAAGVLAVAGCGMDRSVVAMARVPMAVTTAAPSAGPATTAASTTAPAPAPTAATKTTTVAVSAIATHDATLGALVVADAPVPVAVAAGPTSAISGPVVRAGVDPATGELAIPADAAVVAWYEYGPAPGQAGSAVLAGHVDWHGAPGIFFKLRELQPGEPVTVTMSDGSVRGFHVVDTRLVDKPELPLAEVFARTGAPMLTLVTCGGRFDSSTRHYLSNVVVTAAPD